MLQRRTLLTAGTTAAALAALGLSEQAMAQAGLRLGAAKPFAFEALIEQARALAAKPYEPPPPLPREVLERIDYDAHGKLKYKADFALFKDGPGPFPVTFFHMGRYFQTPVHMHVLDKAAGGATGGTSGGASGGTSSGTLSREIVYDPSYFEMPADSPAKALPDGAGFAGFRFQESRLGDQAKLPWQNNDWVAFLGASYFRAIGGLYQYGLSARGVALDVAVNGKNEEFPAFTQVWFEPPADGGDSVVIYALLEGPSIAGAYRFAMRRDQAVVMDIESRLFLRQDIERLGLVPLTSMYWYSDKLKPTGIDWRPEVHDSDGLALWTGGGERIWRPLNNPTATGISAFGDKSPKGFGLMQRDRNFDHYLDGVNYDKRPSLWVEPLSDFGEGAVELVEIPTDDEIHDNIGAFWVPKAKATAGSSYELHYRLHWLADEPFPSPLARCVATRIGRGGVPGQPRPPGVRKFMIEFLGGPLANLPFGVKPEAVLSAPRGQFSYIFTEAVPNNVAGHWRAQFDYTPDGNGPVDLRLFLKNGNETLSETWLYQLLI